ncbi:hypothetical protein BDB01DRAFT_835387 [Pilobolus umbonatus]|nr:hypothetical protein BDB01DRAFT_835387 [Pilobolus umbonatus]
MQSNKRKVLPLSIIATRWNLYSETIPRQQEYIPTYTNVSISTNTTTTNIIISIPELKAVCDNNYTRFKKMWEEHIRDLEEMESIKKAEEIVEEFDHLTKLRLNTKSNKNLSI